MEIVEDLFMKYCHVCNSGSGSEIIQNFVSKNTYTIKQCETCHKDEVSKHFSEVSK